MFQRNYIIALVGLTVGIMLVSPSSAKTEKSVDGGQVFAQHCASCHAAGGNTVNSNRPVAGSKQLVTLAVFKSYLTEPPGHMPFYQDVVNNKEILESLYKYCKKFDSKPVKQS